MKSFFFELQHLAYVYHLLDFCLQETHLTGESNVFLKPFTCFNANGPIFLLPSGETSIFLKHDVIYSSVEITTNLQVGAVY